MAARKRAEKAKYFNEPSVMVVASLESDEKRSGNSFNYELQKLWIGDDDGEPCLVANAGCEPVYVCPIEAIPDLIAFLQKILDAK